MKTFITLLLLPLSVYAFDINGTWSLDTAKTAEFNNKHTNQTALEKALHSCSNEKHTFTEGVAVTEIKDYPCEYNNKKTIIQGTKLTWQYKIIGNNADSIVLEATNDEGASSFVTYNYISPDVIWSYSGGPSHMQDSHLRVYYHREK